MILAIDTATEFASTALYDQEAGAIAEASWHAPMNHTVELMPTIAHIMESQSVTPQQLQGVAVALGPGSFTGLRIGLSVAKGLCLSLGIPIAGIPTLDIVAYAHRGQGLPICAVLQAGRGRICVALYEKENEEWQRITDYHLATVEQVSDLVTGRTLFCGEVDPHLGASLRARLGQQATIASPASSLRRAAYLAELGSKKLSTSGGDDLASLEPLYLHYPKIGERHDGSR